MNNLVFILTIHKEPWAQIAWCLGNFRKCYPEAPLCVIIDGARDNTSSDKDWIEKEFRAEVMMSRPLKGITNGCLWWVRFCQQAIYMSLDSRAAWAVKFDADTRFISPIESVSLTADVSGSLMSDGAPDMHIQGGLQILSMKLVLNLLAHFESAKEHYRSPDSWRMGASEYFVGRGEISTDYMLTAACRRINASMKDNRHIDCRAISVNAPSTHRPDACVTHPHKNQIPE
jgi:hypothetical protein